MDSSNHDSHTIIRKEDIKIIRHDRKQHHSSPEVPEIMAERKEQISSEEGSVVDVDDESQHLRSKVLCSTQNLVQMGEIRSEKKRKDSLIKGDDTSQLSRTPSSHRHNLSSKENIPVVEIKEEIVGGHVKIYWLFPMMMISWWVFGLFCAIGHHFFYRWLNGQVVGDSKKQQWALNIGNGCAILVNFSLHAAVANAYTQHLWRRLRYNTLSLRAIDDAFTIDSNPFSILNLELLSRIPTAGILAGVLWLLPLVSLFAPATLSVTSTQMVNVTSTQVLNIGMFDHGYWKDFNFYKSAPAIMINKVAMSGQIPPPEQAQLPANSSYNLRAFVPLLRCSTANTTTYSQMLEMIAQAGGTESPTLTTGIPLEDLNNKTLSWSSGGMTGEIGYFATVPFHSSPPNSSTKHPKVKPPLLPLLNSLPIPNDTISVNLHPGATLGQIWIAVAKYSRNQSQMQFLNCQLYNTSLKFTVNFTNNAGAITNIEKQWLNPVDTTSRQKVSKNFSSFFVKLSSYIIGTVSHIQNGSQNNFQYDTNMLGTSLGLTSQVDEMVRHMAYKTVWGNEKTPANHIREISVPDLVEEFALNSTLGALSDRLLCGNETANVTVTTTENVYRYEDEVLIISYGLAVLASMGSILLGGYAFSRNGVSHDSTVSTFATAMQNPEVRELLEQYPAAAQPLDEKLEKIKLRFISEDGFVLNDSVGKVITKHEGPQNNSGNLQTVMSGAKASNP